LRRAATALALGLGVGAVAPACYTGSARDVPAPAAALAARNPSWRIVGDVPFVAQRFDGDCGPAALAMVLGHFGVRATLEELAGQAAASEGHGVRAGRLRDLARRMGLEAFVVSGTLDDLFAQVERGRPVVVGLAEPVTGGRVVAHYEVVVGLNRQERLIRLLDPGRGLRENTLEGFAREWVPTRQVTIVVFPSARHTVI
jgi:ABC-type bacteriocin/lantibiotic exporter with double-glycine peptidase domain